MIALLGLLILSARADEIPATSRLGFSIDQQALRSDHWDRFTEMDRQQGVWSSGPTSSPSRKLRRFSTDYIFAHPGERGELAAELSLVWPTSVKVSGTPQGQATVKKESSIWGARIGPRFRLFPFASSAGFFLDGGLHLGFLSIQQKIQGGSSGQLFASAVDYGATVAAGVRIFPAAAIQPIFRAGYTIGTSGKFMATKTSGSAFADFQSGDIVSLRDGNAVKDLKVRTTGWFVSLGVSIPFHRAEPTAEVPAPVPAAPPAPTATPEPSIDGVTPEVAPEILPKMNDHLPNKPPAENPTVPSAAPEASPDEAPLVPVMKPRAPLPETAPQTPAPVPAPDAETKPSPEPVLPEPTITVPDEIPTPIESAVDTWKNSGAPEFPATSPDAHTAPEKIEFDR